MRLIDADELFTTPMPCSRGNGKPLSSLWAYVVDQIAHAPTVDAVEVDRVALMLKESFGDSCACNFNGNDEWLPFVCEHQETCPYPEDVLGCWKQFVKHFWERRADDE